MIILDASAVIDLLLRASMVPEVSNAAEMADSIACPVILDFEVLNVLRRQVQNKIISLEQANRALEDYDCLRIARFETLLLSDRIWQLRNNFTAYDASYIALAELLEVPLLTRDFKWKNQTEHRADIRFI